MISNQSLEYSIMYHLLCAGVPLLAQVPKNKTYSMSTRTNVWCAPAHIKKNPLLDVAAALITTDGPC